MKICLIKTSSMGDIIHALPALTDAKQQFPDLQVDWVVEENFAEIPRWHRAVQRVIPIALRRWRKAPCAQQTRTEWKQYRALLQQEKYDAVIDAQGLFKSAWFATRLARGEREGYSWQCAREPLASLFYDRRFFIDYQQHAVERIRQLVAQSLGYACSTVRGDYGIASAFNPPKSAVDFVIFFHGTTRADKCWQEQAWRDLAARLNAQGIAVRLPWSNDEELRRAEYIAEALPLTEILPKSNLQQLATDIAQSRAVVSVDTGLAHLTAALNKPNVSLYGATDPALVGTYGANQYHLRGESMAVISVDKVWQALQTAGLFEDCRKK